METNGMYVMGADPASKSRDYSCIVVLRQGPGSEMHVVDLYRGRVGARKLRIMTHVLSRLYRVDSTNIYC